MLRKDRLGALFMRRVEVGKEEAHGDRLDLRQASDRLRDLGEIELAERRHNLTRGVDPLGDLEFPVG